ncbi:unnamed protein product [Lactuca saligna]|uniref:Uncharacterized protein n=1 Tax=Lactuca saligna TaxID=75948 RepID=A0AA35ZCS8_LACSI|nr:unnamed protein product [Lactuca saligna]
MKLTEGDCDNVYYCNRKECLDDGIRRIDLDADYWEFVEAVYSEVELDVYIDHRKEPILDWAGNEVLVYDMSDDNKYGLDEEDDKDSKIYDTKKYEHEHDEEVYTFDKTVGDKFLNKLSGDLSDDDESNNGKYMEVVFHIHDENQ